MKHFLYNELGENKPVRMSEYEILAAYFPYWYKAMCTKYGKEKVEERYTIADCITDWCVVHWAWEDK